MIIETERLLLRPIVKSDAEDIFRYAQSENVGPNAGWKPHESIDETLEIMRYIFIGQQGIFGIVLKESGRMIGSIGLIADPKRENHNVRMLGYAIGECHWGEGYMTEAAHEVINYGFTVMDLELISAYCYPHNFRSKRVLEKLGFTYEGTLRRSELLFNGEVYDNVCYSILKSL